MPTSGNCVKFGLLSLFIQPPLLLSDENIGGVYGRTGKITARYDLKKRFINRLNKWLFYLIFVLKVLLVGQRVFTSGSKRKAKL